MYKVYSGERFSDIIVFSCLYRLSSTKRCLKFLLIYFTRKIKDFYQISWENEVDFTDKIYDSPKSGDWGTTLCMKKQSLKCHLVTGKRLYLFAWEKKKNENAFLKPYLFFYKQLGSGLIVYVFKVFEDQSCLMGAL